MKTIKCLIFLMLILSTSCGRTQKLEFFGETVIVDYPKRMDTLSGHIVVLEGEYTGLLFAYDGMLVFASDLHPDGWLYLYSAETGKRINAIVQRGNGPDEFVNPQLWSRFEKDSNEIYIWINDLPRNNLVLLNTQGERVREINTSKFKSTNPYGVGAFHMLNDSLLLAHVQPWRIFENRFTASGEHVFNYQLGKTVRTYMFYSEYESPNNVHGVSPGNYLTSNSTMKPDKTKLATAMFNLKRLNILDIESGKIKSIATTDAPDLNHLWSGKPVVEHYRGIKSDERYIYVIESTRAKRTEINAIYWSEYLSKPSGRIFVFDWGGNFVRILYVEEDVVWITFDPIRRILYSKTDCEIVRAYDLNFLYK